MICEKVLGGKEHPATICSSYNKVAGAIMKSSSSSTSIMADIWNTGNPRVESTIFITVFSCIIL